MRKLSQMSKEDRRERRSSIIVYITLRISIVICMISQLINGDLNNAFLCAMTLVLFILPEIIKHHFKMELPNLLETIIFIFIYASKILGEIYNFYGNIPHWDTMLHTINGFLCAGIGFGLVDLLNRNSKTTSMSPIFLAIVACSFSMMIGTCWEIYEYASDKLIRTDMQKDAYVTNVSTVKLNPDGLNKSVHIEEIDHTIIYDGDGKELAVIKDGYLDIGINDTMKDLIVNLVGAVIFSTLGYFYILNREKYKFTAHFIPRAQDSK